MGLPESKLHRLEQYHQARRNQEFPEPMTVGGFVTGGILTGLIFGPLGAIVGSLAGGTAAYLYGRRTSYLRGRNETTPRVFINYINILNLLSPRFF